jgi:hypothetical protein
LSPRAAACLLAVLLPLCALRGEARAGLADRIGATFGLMASEFVKAFQPIEGLVVAVDGTIIYLDVGASAGGQVGQEFTIYRKGEPFYHAMTGRLLGHFEDVLGHAQVRRVEARFSEARFVAAGGGSPARRDDGARITRGRIKVAVAPVLDLTSAAADTRRVPYLLATALEGSKRFQVADPLTVGDLFVTGAVRVEEMLARPERAMRVAKSLDVAGWLVPILLERRGVTYLDVTWISSITGTALFSRRQPLLRESGAEEQRFPWEPRVED